MAEKFLEFFQLELSPVATVVPDDPERKAAAFLDVVRSLDFYTVCQGVFPENLKLSYHDFQLLTWGWNSAAQLLLTPISQTGAMPIQRDSGKFAATVLHQAGRACLLKRTSDMIRHGFLTVDESAEGFVVRKSHGLGSQFADLLEVERLDDLNRLRDDMARHMVHGWSLVDYEHAMNSMDMPGAFMSRSLKSPFAEWKQDDVDSLMGSLIFPWDSGSGIMMGYGAHPDVDLHFLLEGLNLILACRNEAGLHPACTISDTSGADVTAVAAVVVGLHLKHIRFALLSQKTHPEIRLEKSLTIWGPRSELVESIAEFMGIESGRVSRALSAITVKASEAEIFANRTTPLIPLVIDLENGFILRPVSSISRNPLNTVIPIQQHRAAQSLQKVVEPREEWLRADIHAAFQGNRYVRVEGNVNLRDGNHVLTDVDAAVFDRTCGDLALFQIKWQDFDTNDVRQLRSKASNFVADVDKWATNVCRWISTRSMLDVGNTFRINPSKDGPVLRIFLFVVSRHVCRMAGYGFKSANAFLAFATWPQWMRVRAEVGPVPHVMDRIHEQLCKEYEREVSVLPFPYKMNVASVDAVVQYEDVFVRFDDLSGSENQEERSD